MKVKFNLLSHKVSHLSIQPTTSSTTKLITSADISRPQLWLVDFSVPDPIITHIHELTGHEYSVKVVSWSPRGKYLITACDYPTLWIDTGHDVKSLGKLYHEQSEVHAVEWAPDEKRVIVATQNNSLHLYDIETRQLIKRLGLDFTPVGVAWDPLNSYIGVLTTENCLNIYSANNLETKKKVGLSLSGQKFSDIRTKRLDRKIAWSTDGEFCICPSLEDKNELPVACGINRIRNFEITNVFAGPSAAVTCIAFLDMIFKKDKDLYTVFALGDSDGNISLWQTKGSNKPLFYIKGGYEDMSIESISWEPKSKMIFASTTKKFIMMINYDPNAFGTPLPPSEKQSVLESIYGKQTTIPIQSQSYLDRRYNESQAPLLNGNDMMNAAPTTAAANGAAAAKQEQLIASLQPKKIQIRRKGDPVEEKKDVVASDTSKTVVKPTVVGVPATDDGPTSDSERKKQDNEARMKKSSEKNMELEESKIKDDGKEKETEKAEGKDHKIRVRPKNTLNNLNLEYSHPPKAEKICFPKIKQGLDNFKMNIMEKNVLTIKTEKKIIDGSEMATTKLTCLGSMGPNMSETIWTDIIEGKVLMVEHNSEYLCYYTDGHLLCINNLVTGKRMELPLVVPNLARMKLNSKNFIMLIREDGDLRVYNFEDKKVLLDENCYSLVKELSASSPPTAESICLDDDGIPYICLKANLVIFYNTELKAWQKVDGGIFNFGIFKNIPKPFKSTSNSSIMLMNKTPKEKFEDFVKEIAGGEVNPEKLRYDNRITVIRKIEEGMIYAMTKNDVKAYYDLAGIYVGKLADFHEFNKIRCFIIEDLMKNNNSKDYKFIKSKLTNEEDFTKFINHLRSKLSSNQEIVQNLKKEIDTVIENLNFKSIFKKEGKE